MLKPYVTENIAVSSVPYFNEACGMTFKLSDFEYTCDEFYRRLHSFAPREYIKAELGLERSANLYLHEYVRLACP